MDRKKLDKLWKTFAAASVSNDWIKKNKDDVPIDIKLVYDKIADTEGHLKKNPVDWDAAKLASIHLDRAMMNLKKDVKSAVEAGATAGKAPAAKALVKAVAEAEKDTKVLANAVEKGFGNTKQRDAHKQIEDKLPGLIKQCNAAIKEHGKHLSDMRAALKEVKWSVKQDIYHIPKTGFLDDFTAKHGLKDKWSKDTCQSLIDLFEKQGNASKGYDEKYDSYQKTLFESEIAVNSMFALADPEMKKIKKVELKQINGQYLAAAGAGENIIMSNAQVALKLLKKKLKQLD